MRRLTAAFLAADLLMAKVFRPYEPDDPWYSVDS